MSSPIDELHMDEFASCKETWEGIARKDPLWGILTDESKTDRRWDNDEFFQTGRHEISIVFDYLHSIGLRPDGGAALDFGCGVGRLTQALAERFSSVHGIDISETMITEANDFNRLPAKCHYAVNGSPDLRLFSTDSFDFIYSSIVLPVRYVERYLSEFIRVLKPNGVLLFQMPDAFRAKIEEGISLWTKLRSKARLRTRFRRWLSQAGLLKQGEGSPAMQMNSIPEIKIRKLINRLGARVTDIKLTNSTDPGFDGNLRFLEAEPLQGWISKQYCVIK